MVFGDLGRYRNDNSACLLLFCIALISVLPSGVIAGFPVKYFLLLIIILVFIKSGPRYSRSFFAHSFFTASFFIAYAAVGYLEFSTNAVIELVYALSAIIMGMVAAQILLKRGCAADIIFLYKLTIFLLVAAKSAILAAYFSSTGYESFMSHFSETYRAVTGADLVTMPLPFGLIRIHMQVDVLVALFPLALTVLDSSRAPGRSVYIFIGLSLAIVLLGFSRYNIAVYFVSLAYYIFFSRHSMYLKLTFCVVLTMLGFLLYQEIASFISARFFSDANALSDDIRFGQVSVLLAMFYNAPLIGHGLGAYADTLVRSESAPFSYEMQLVSFLPKFGLLGCAVIGGYITYIITRLVAHSQGSMAIFVILFVGSAFFNPNLFSSNMVLFYTVVYFVYFRWVGFGFFSRSSRAHFKSSLIGRAVGGQIRNFEEAP